MKRYDMACPYCGHLNRGLYLEETEGMMECENCGHTARETGSFRPARIPLPERGKEPPARRLVTPVT